MGKNFDELLDRVRACRACIQQLDHAPKPVLSLDPCAEILIIGRSPGHLAHQNEKLWSDSSGKRLREWMNITENVFYDQKKIAILPMGFCYPGHSADGGELPPMTQCAHNWHRSLRVLLPHIKLTLLVGNHAQKHYLPETYAWSMEQRLQMWQRFLPDYLILPNPSWRNHRWLKKNNWFQSQILPVLQRRVHHIMELSDA